MIGVVAEVHVALGCHGEEATPSVLVARIHCGYLQFLHALAHLYVFCSALITTTVDRRVKSFLHETSQSFLAKHVT